MIHLLFKYICSVVAIRVLYFLYNYTGDSNIFLYCVTKLDKIHRSLTYFKGDKDMTESTCSKRDGAGEFIPAGEKYDKEFEFKVIPFGSTRTENKDGGHRGENFDDGKRENLESSQNEDEIPKRSGDVKGSDNESINKIVDLHKQGVFIPTESKISLNTLNLASTNAVNDQTILSVEDWNTLKRNKLSFSKTAALIMKSIICTHIRSGNIVLYLGVKCYHTVTDVSDAVGPEGVVYVILTNKKSFESLCTLSESKTNIIPIDEDPLHPAKYQYSISSHVDVIFSDFKKPRPTNFLAINAHFFLKLNGQFIITIANADGQMTNQLKNLSSEKLIPEKLFSLYPFVNNYMVVSGKYLCPPEEDIRQFCNSFLTN